MMSISQIRPSNYDPRYARRKQSEDREGTKKVPKCLKAVEGRRQWAYLAQKKVSTGGEGKKRKKHGDKKSKKAKKGPGKGGKRKIPMK